jgi:hypothetical protein
MKLLWVEGVLTTNRHIHLVKRRNCSLVEGTIKTLVPKFDFLLEHEGHSRPTKTFQTRG